MTLVHFLASAVEEKYTNIIGFEEDLSHVEQAAKCEQTLCWIALSSFACKPHFLIFLFCLDLQPVQSLCICNIVNFPFLLLVRKICYIIH